MNAIEFLNLAHRLAASTGEAQARSSISRSYYAAFHVAKELIESCGVVLPDGPEAHARLRQCLGNCGDANAAAAASKLDSLRLIRNDADYELHSINFESADAQHQLGNARRIIESLSTCNVSTIQPKVREYAQQILRLPIRTEG